jgi:hypothetical protein
MRGARSQARALTISGVTPLSSRVLTCTLAEAKIARTAGRLPRLLAVHTSSGMKQTRETESRSSRSLLWPPAIAPARVEELLSLPGFSADAMHRANARHRPGARIL